MARTTLKQVRAALIKWDGVPVRAAEELGISRSAICQRIQNNPALRELITEIEETLVDVAEGNVAKALREGDGQTTRWFLERKGRARGFGNATAVRLDDDALRDIVGQVAEAGGVEGLRKLINGGI